METFLKRAELFKKAKDSGVSLGGGKAVQTDLCPLYMLQKGGRKRMDWKQGKGRDDMTWRGVAWRGVM